MTSDIAGSLVNSRASGSNSHSVKNGIKRNLPPIFYDEKALQIGDQNAWYYPIPGLQGLGKDEDEDLNVSTQLGNWGKKNKKGSRWVRRGKAASWGPGVEEWEAEDRARKRIKRLITPPPRSPSPPSLAHLRSPSPPQASPFPPPVSQYYDYTAFVMDKAVNNSFRSDKLLESELACTDLIEGETILRQALGKLWQTILDFQAKDSAKVTADNAVNGVLTNGHSHSEDSKEDPKAIIDDKIVEDKAEVQRRERMARAADLTPGAWRAFLTLTAEDEAKASLGEVSHFPENQLQPCTTMEEALGVVKELQDDEREYCERLDEIREAVGDVRAQRDLIWDAVREQAIGELRMHASYTISR